MATAGAGGGAGAGASNSAAAPATPDSVGFATGPADSAEGFTKRPDGVYVVDGSVLEGGGQVLRNGTALAAILGVPLRIVDIRGKRKKSGLKRQHLTGLELVRSMYDGTMKGGELNSTQLEFVRKHAACQAGSYTADVKTAGSLMLVFQVSLPCAVFATGPVTIDAKGGTNCIMAPQVDFTQQLFKPVAAKFGVDFDMTINRRGFYPRGGGHVTFTVRPATQPLTAITMDTRGDVTALRLWVVYSGKMPKRIAETLLAVMREALKLQFAEAGIDWPSDVTESIEHSRAPDAAAACMCIAETSTGCKLAGSHILDKRSPPKKGGMQAAKMLMAELAHGGCLDEYLTDQVIVFMALAKGVSKIKTGPLSLHTKTAIHYASLFTGARFKVTPSGEGGLIVECNGVGLQPPAAASQ